MVKNSVVNAILLPYVVKGANMRMIQAGDSLGLPFKALAQFGVAREVGG